MRNKFLKIAPVLFLLSGTAFAVGSAVRIIREQIIEFTQTTTPANPAANKNRLYFKSTGKPYFLSSAGVEQGLPGDALVKDINQTTHGFAVGDVIYYTGSAWAKAKADVDATSEVLGVVSAVAGANDFTVTQLGYISGLSGLTAGTTYYLSAATAGALTATAPTTAGQVSKPVYVAVSTTEAYVIHSRGAVIESQSIGILGSWGDCSSLITFENIGTPSELFLQCRTIGEDYEVRGYVRSGTPAASTFAIVLPAGKTIKTSTYSSTSGIQRVGVMHVPSGGPATNLFDGANGSVLFFDGSTNNKIFAAFTGGGTAQQFDKGLGTTFFGTNWRASINFTVTVN